MEKQTIVRCNWNISRLHLTRESDNYSSRTRMGLNATHNISRHTHTNNIFPDCFYKKCLCFSVCKIFYLNTEITRFMRTYLLSIILCVAFKHFYDCRESNMIN